MTRKEEIKLAFEIGKDAFNRHIKRVPAADPKLLQMLMMTMQIIFFHFQGLKKSLLA